MNLSETVDKIIELHQQPIPPETSVAEYLQSTLWGVNAHVEIQRFSFSVHAPVWVIGAVFILSLILLMSIIRRWHRVACVSALAIPLILSLELLFHIPIVSFPTLKKAENIIADFPVQNAARRIIVGTSITLEDYQEASEQASSQRFEATASAFLLPMTLVIAIIGLWQLLIFYGKLDFEDARTIMLIMGSVCVVYFALLCGSFVRSAKGEETILTRKHNAGSIAVLAALSEDLAKKYPRLENTWVTVAFIGDGPDGWGARALARRIMQRRKRKLPTYYVGCERIGRGGPHGYLISGDVNDNPLFAERELIRTLNGATIQVTGRQLEIVPERAANSRGFVDYGVPAIAITTRPRTGSKPDRIDRGQLLISLQMIEAALLRFEQSQSL